MSGWSLVRARARVAETSISAVAVMLAALCLIPLFVDMRWLLPAFVMVAVIAITGLVCRGLAMPLPLVPVAEALALLMTLTAMFAGSAAFGRVVPTSAGWDVLRGLLAQGMADAQVFGAPVPTYPGMVMLAIGGVGLVALSTDTLFVSVRSPLLAGLPLASLYLAPALLSLSGAPWWSFAPAAAGWLLILAADQRDQVREWSGVPSTTRIRGLSSGARRTAAVVIVAATVIALVLPMRGITAWRSGEGTGPGGVSSVGELSLNPLVTMRRDLLQTTDTEVLTYRTQATSPSYLRISVLDDFDGTTWRPSADGAERLDGSVPLPGNVLTAMIASSESNRVRGGSSFTYLITVSNLQNRFLPLPYPISEVNDVDGLETVWRLDPDTGVAFSDDTPATGITYRVGALDPGVVPSQLRAAPLPQGDFATGLAVPEGTAPAIGDLTRRLTADAKTSYDKAVALQRWFTRGGGFTYSTNVRSGADVDYLAEFLTDRVGYCEQFAGAMALMARIIGIPSRVVVGFTQGTPDADGTWHVTARDAHAWPELWFEDVGWVRFEPTPRSGGTVLTPDYARTPVSAGAASGQVPGQPLPREGLLDDANPGGGSTGRSIPWTGIVLLLGAVVLIASAVPMTRRTMRRRRRLHAWAYRAVVDGAWDEVGDLAVDLGQPWSPVSTPRQAAERLSDGMAAPAAAALLRLRQEVEQVRYARVSGRLGGDGSAERAGAIRADVRTVWAELRGRVNWQTRVRAYCWPSSERRRQRSSMRSMNPEDFAARGADGLAGAASSPAGRVPKAE